MTRSTEFWGFRSMNDTRITRPLWVRITACGFAAVLFSSAAIGGLAWYSEKQMSEHALETELASDLAFFETDMAAQSRNASTLALSLASQPETADLIETKSHDGLLQRYSGSFPDIKGTSNLALITFSQADATVLARIHEPDVFGDNISARRKTVVAAISDNRLTAGIEPGRTAVSIFASAPVAKDGKVVGVVDVGTKLTEDYFARLAKDIDANIALHLQQDGKFVKQATTFPGDTMLSEADLAAAFDDQKFHRYGEQGGRTYTVTAVPLKDFSGKKVGVIEIASNVTQLVAQTQEALWLTVVGTAAMSILSLIGFLWFARSIAGSIRGVTDIMSRLATGDLSAEVHGKDRPDEIGAMARAVQVFKDAAETNRRLERDAEEARAAQEAQRGRQTALDNAKAEDLRAFIHAVEDGFNSLSDGDLTVRMRTSVAPEFEPIRAKFNGSVEKLEEAIGSVVGAVRAIRGGLNEISSASGDLAKRTEQQAASLEETAAALSEVTSGVNDTALSADQAQIATSTAQRNAERGGEIVSNAVSAMVEIEQSSDQIGKITGVINDIAFQTNLLALNAGVEAARAGEAGRGFAVVAQEVRGLAQRSAEAAKEIKTLIANSTSQVKRGVELVTASGTSLEEIVAQVGQISAVVAEIARNAREQAVRLKEVSGAADQMDQVTQQNAAMVEETTAAARNLSHETEDLAGMVDRFKTQQARGYAQPAAGQSYRRNAA